MLTSVKRLWFRYTGKRVIITNTDFVTDLPLGQHLHQRSSSRYYPFFLINPVLTLQIPINLAAPLIILIKIVLQK